MRFLLLPLFAFLSAFSVAGDLTVVPGSTATTLTPDPRAPLPGKYAGVVTITKDFHREDISSKVTMRAYARVTTSGDLTIVAVVPESPSVAADNPESTLSRGVLLSDGTYLMDGKHRAVLTKGNGSFQLQLSNSAFAEYGGRPPDPVASVADVEGSIAIATTRIDYRFYPQAPSKTRQAR